MIELIAGLALGGLVIYLLLRPSLKAVKVFNESIEQQNIEQQYKNQELVQEQQQLLQSIQQLKESVIKLDSEIQLAECNKENVLQSIKESQENSQRLIDEIYNRSYALMQENLSVSAERLAQQYRDLQGNYRIEYEKAMDESAQELGAWLSELREEIYQEQVKLDNLKCKHNAIIEASKREEEKALEIDKYKILITDADLTEINRLREIVQFFRNPRPIYKIIWEGYYRTNTNNMIARVVGAGVITGIYKITNLKNNKTYIGQSADIGTRLTAHVKAGLGIDTPNNILYQAMLKDGVENFTFEVIEECPRESLNDRETYWIDFHQSQTWGYNMTRGGAALTGARK